MASSTNLNFLLKTLTALENLPDPSIYNYTYKAQISIAYWTG